MPSVSEVLEVIRPWWTTAAATGSLGFLGRLWLQARKIRITEREFDRDGFGVLITALQADVVNLRAEHKAEIAEMRRTHAEQLAAMQEEHRTCQERLSKIEGELMGFHRQAIIRSQTEAAMLGAPPMILKAGERAIQASAPKTSET